MKFIKKILIVSCALFIQFTSLTTAMDAPPHCEIFEQQDIMSSIVNHFGKETPFTDFWSYCSTNQKNYARYKDDANILKQIALQSQYLNHDLQFLNPNNIASYRMLLACVEKDLPQLMDISRELNPNWSYFEIKYETSLDMHKVFQMLVKIRTLEKKINPLSTPLDLLSIFSLETRKILWDAEGAAIPYLYMYNHEYCSIRSTILQSAQGRRSDIFELFFEQYFKHYQSPPNDLLAFQYINIIFPLQERGVHFKDFNSSRIFEFYWFTMLACEFFHKHPEISLIFSLSLGYEGYRLFLNLKGEEKLFDYAYNEFSRRSKIFPKLSSYLESKQDVVLNLKKQKKPFDYGYHESEKLSRWIDLYQEEPRESYYFNERRFADKKIFLKRRECLEFALQELPEAWDLYERDLKFDNYPEEITGIEKPEVVAQLPN